MQRPDRDKVMEPYSLAHELPGICAIEAGGPVEPVASEVLRAFGNYGWPAIQAALDNPGYPRDPAVWWPRTFPKRPTGPQVDDEVGADRRSATDLNETVERAESGPAPSRPCSADSRATRTPTCVARWCGT